MDRILLIDDEPDVLSVMSTRLRLNGYEVSTAEDGKEGLAKARKEKPDLVILDVMMPVMDGFQFFKEIKTDDALRDVPVLVLTARGAMKGTFEALDAEAFVSKPFNTDELLSKIKRLLQQKVLVLSTDNIVNEKLSGALDEKGYVSEIVPDENAMLSKGREEKFRAVVAHLSLVKEDPGSLVSGLKSFKKQNTPLVLYCDATVPGMERNDTVAIEDVRMKWKKAGVDNFYDPRMTKEPFGDFFSKIMGPSPAKRLS